MANRTCTIVNCGLPLRAVGLCNKHYYRNRIYGDPLFTKTAGTGDPIEFIRAAIKNPTDDCIEWPYAKKESSGHGIMRFKGRNRGAHAVALELTIGSPPDGMECCHNCGNPGCVNNTHLRWGTRQENMADRPEHGHDTRGRKHWNVKLTAKDVLEIRDDSRSYPEIAKDYGVARTTIQSVKQRRSWAWLT